MNSNLMFAFNRRSIVYAAPPAPRAPAPRAPAPRAPAPRVPVTQSNRFSMNRLINLKSGGGCRSCS